MEKITVVGNRFNKRLFGTALARQALSYSEQDTVWVADIIQGIGMNAVRFSRQDEVIDLDRWYWMLKHFKERGVYWVVPLRTVHKKGDIERFTSQSRIKSEKARIDALYGSINPYTKMTLGEDPALALVDIANEASVWLELYPGQVAWDSMSNTAKRGLVATVRAIEEDFMGQLGEHMKNHTDAIQVGSQTNYEMQGAALDAQDTHLYINRPNPARLPAKFDNRRVLDDRALWPCTMAYDRLPDKPMGCSEFNDSGPSWFYGSNLLTIGAVAALQDWSFLLHHHMGDYTVAVKDMIPGELLDATHLGKIEILKLIKTMFLDHEIAPVEPVGFESPDYYEDVAKYGVISGTSILMKKGSIDYWRPLKGSRQVSADFGEPLRINTASLNITAYNTVTYGDKPHRTIGRCENRDMVWDDRSDDVNSPPKRYSSWGKGPVWLEVL